MRPAAFERRESAQGEWPKIDGANSMQAIIQIIAFVDAIKKVVNLECLRLQFVILNGHHLLILKDPCDVAS